MKTLGKIILGVVAGVIFLVLAAVLAINTDFVQNKVLQYATNRLSEKLQMPLKADSISINFFKLRAQLFGVDVELPKGKTATQVSINSLYLDIIGKDVDIQGLRFKTDNHKPRKNEGKPKRGWFDAGHLDILADVQLRVHRIDKDSIAASIVHLNATDSISGFFIKDLHLDATTDMKQIHFRNAEIQHENTIVNIPGLELWLPSKKKEVALSYYTTEPLTAHVVLKDISRLFTKALEQFTMPLELSVMVEGDANTMQFRDIKVNNEDERLHIFANGGIENLREKYLLNISFHVDEMLAKSGIKHEIIDQFPVKQFMMTQLNRLGDIRYTGDFSVLRKREVFSGIITTSKGHLELKNLTLNDSTKFVSGTVNTNDLELGQVIDMKDIGKISADATFEVDISKERTAEVRRTKGGKLPVGAVEATVKEANYKKVKVKNIDVTIYSDGAVAEGELENRSRIADSAISFSFDDTKEMHKMKIKPHIKIHLPRIFSKKKK